MTTSPVKLWRRQKHISSLIGKKGEIVLVTIIRIPARNFQQQAPYPVVIVRLQNGEKMIGQMVDWQKDDLVKGRKIITVLRRSYTEDKEAVIMYSIKFKPHENY